MGYLRDMAHTLVESGGPHTARINDWVAAVDKMYHEFSSEMDSYKRQLEKTLGIQNRSPRGEMASSMAKDKLQHREFNEEKRKSARKRE